MYNYELNQLVNKVFRHAGLDISGKDNHFYARLIASASSIHALYQQIYRDRPDSASFFELLILCIIDGYIQRPGYLRENDETKLAQGQWYLSHKIAGMSLYVDRWCGQLKDLPSTFGYLKELGINLLHLMPIFQSPPDASDGGYAVSDFRVVDPKFGSLGDLQKVRQEMEQQGIFLMLDIVLNHTSDRHEWAERAKAGDAVYLDYYYMFDDRRQPDEFDRAMPDIFPESSPGNFTYVPECQKWAMTVFHHYQWDLNYRNPMVLIAMLGNIFFYANLGVDILRIDAPAFIWKEPGTTSQNLPCAHTILRLIKQCVQAAAPGMALLGEAIVAPSAIMKYFGNGTYSAKECDLAYNATQMALQWDALATGDTRVMLAAQPELLQKPYGASWITYVRGHDDIGLGYEDDMIIQAGYQALPHRKFLQDYYSGNYPGSDAMGALFSVNPKTQDARISGALASLCGLERALLDDDRDHCRRAIQKILLMQAQSCFIGGIPMLFYGDEAGYTNDYSYQSDSAKNYDNRWMHRPVIDWEKNKRARMSGTVEEAIFSGTQRLLAIRRRLPVVSDHKNIVWLSPHNMHVAGFVRMGGPRLYCLFNFSREKAFLTYYAFREHGPVAVTLYDHWSETSYKVGKDEEYLVLEPYTFLLLEDVAAHFL